MEFRTFFSLFSFSPAGRMWKPQNSCLELRDRDEKKNKMAHLKFRTTFFSPPLEKKSLFESQSSLEKKTLQPPFYGGSVWAKSRNFCDLLPVSSQPDRNSLPFSSSGSQELFHVPSSSSLARCSKLAFMDRGQRREERGTKLEHLIWIWDKNERKRIEEEGRGGNHEGLNIELVLTWLKKTRKLDWFEVDRSFQRRFGDFEIRRVRTPKKGPRSSSRESKGEN